MTAIPHRLRQSYCQQFVICFEFALNQAPQPFKVLGFELAATTLAARLRDAHLSMRQFSWGPEGVRNSKFVVTHDVDGVTITVDKLEAFASQKTAGPAHLLTLTTEQVEAFCILLSAGLITGPITVLNDFDSLYLSNLEARHNIALTLDPDTNSFILL